jgi:hypothetical protein
VPMESRGSSPFAGADASRLRRIATLGGSFRRRFESILSTFTKLVVEQIWERVREFLASPQAPELGPNLPHRGNPPRRRSRRCPHFSVSQKPPGITQVMGEGGMVKVRGQKSPSAGIVAMLAVDETTRPTLEIDVFFLKFKPMLLFRSGKQGSPAPDLSAPTHTNLICCIRLSAGRSNRATWQCRSFNGK